MIASGYEIPQIETKEIIKYKGRIWTIHSNDKDFKFGSRHAHDKKNGRILNLDSGEIIDRRSNTIIEKWKEKDLNEFKSLSRFFK